MFELSDDFADNTCSFEHRRARLQRSERLHSRQLCIGRLLQYADHMQ
jgi:hypothetical protein